MNDTGKLWEIKAADYLRKKKYKILDVNYTTRFGEIDLIAQKKNYLCFVEVKQRDEKSPAQPKEFVDYNKQKRMAATANIYLINHGEGLQPRFDVIEIITSGKTIKSLKHLENAFDLY